MMTFDDLQMWAHSLAKEKGWYDPPKTPGEQVLMCITELTEAVEFLRTHEPTDVWMGEDGKPEGFGIELADCIIRIADMASFHEISLEAMVEMKMRYNETRSYRHGGKAL